MNQLKIWLIGRAGMLGSAMEELLIAKQIPYAGSDQEVDIRSLAAMKSFCKGQNFTHIVNCAAYTAVEKAEQEREKAFAVNAQGVKNLSDLAAILGIKIIHYSTDYVFDGTKKEPYTEDDMPHPLNVYGKSKLLGETYLKEPHIIIRTSWLFGRMGENFVLKMLQKMQELDELKVVADQVGRPTFCEDLAEATLNLLPFSGIFHFSNLPEVSWYDFARAVFNIAKEMGFVLKCRRILPIKSSEYPTLATRPLYSVLDCSKYEKSVHKKILNWHEGVKKCLKERVQQY